VLSDAAGCCKQPGQPIVVLVRDFLQLAVVLAILIGVFGSLEKLWGLRRQKLFRKAFGTDLVYYFLSGILPRLILILPLSLLARGAHLFFGGTLYQWTAALPLAVRVVLAAVVGDIGSYWGHRWSHEIPWLWRFHSVHHSAEEMDWLINTRAHPVDLIFTRLCGYVPMYVLGLAQPMAGAQLDVAPLIVIVLGTFWGYFIHANLRWRFGWFEYLVSTPHFHHWHHNARPESINKNYSALLPGVDAMFGTLYLPAKTWPEQYGTQDPVAETLAAQLLVSK
jgi:sterol desaturase/sphingolipid hydroxylase (fatty acid hydroxylase superfamily)